MKFRQPAAKLLIAAHVAAFSWPAFAEAEPRLRAGRPASAQAIDVPDPRLFCGAHTEITSRLGKRYGESRIGFGRLDDGRLVEIFASPGGTWSLLVTRPNSPTCLVASGDGWETIVEPTRLPRASRSHAEGRKASGGQEIEESAT